MKVYRTNTWSNQIEEKEVIETNDKSIFYLNYKGKRTRDARVSNYTVWHDTKEQAIEHLKKQWNNEIDSLNTKLEKYKALLNEIS